MPLTFFWPFCAFSTLDGDREISAKTKAARFPSRSAPLSFSETSLNRFSGLTFDVQRAVVRFHPVGKELPWRVSGVWGQWFRHNRLQFLPPAFPPVFKYLVQY